MQWIFLLRSYYSLEYCTFQSHIGRRIGSSHMFLSNHRTGKEYVSLRCMTKLYQHFQSSFHSSLTFVSLRARHCPQNQQTCWDLGPPLVLKRNRDKLRKQIGRIGETGIASLLLVTFPGFQKIIGLQCWQPNQSWTTCCCRRGWLATLTLTCWCGCLGLASRPSFSFQHDLERQGDEGLSQSSLSISPACCGRLM